MESQLRKEITEKLKNTDLSEEESNTLLEELDLAIKLEKSADNYFNKNKKED